MRPIRVPPVKYDTFQLLGGLDMVTPTLSLKPGFAREAVNFEASVTGGYSRIAGYERYDGQPSPDDADYVILTISSLTGVAVGDVINNLAVTVTGKVIAVEGQDIVYTKAVGAFAVSGTLYVGATPVGTIQSITTYAGSPEVHAHYKAAAADIYRADIAKPPGSGRIRGGVTFNGVTYVWRDNAGGTAMDVHKSTSAGWVQVPLGFTVAFNTGASTAPADGATITGATSGATGVVKRVVLTSGTTWVGGSGILVFTTITGTFQAAENLQVGGVTKAVAVGAQAAITLAPGGRVQTVVGNLTGSVSATRVYGCDNVNKGFEFDGTVYVPITTGMAADTPTNVAVHKNMLFFSFGPSSQNSGVGTPYVWSPVFGANEIALPDAVTAYDSLPGDATTGALAIYTQKDVFLLYGTSPGTFNLVNLGKETGSARYTAQTMTESYALDNRGVVSLKTSRDYGNFDSATLTFPIRPFMQQRRGTARASGINHEKSQYRLFFEDASALYCTIVNGRLMGSMPVQLLDTMNCWWEGTSATGAETSFTGGDSGYVYKMDTGPDFDGAAIVAGLKLNFNPQGNSRVLKRYRFATFEVTGTGFAKFHFAYALAYDDPDVDQAPLETQTVSFSSSYWDTMVWDEFVWDGRTLAPTEAECLGTAQNIAVILQSNSRYDQPYTINSITFDFTPRRGM